MALNYIGAVFASKWGYCKDSAPNLDDEEEPRPEPRPRRGRRQRPRDPGAAEDDEFAENQKKVRVMGSRLSQCRVFLSMVCISFIGKKPLRIFNVLAAEGFERAWR